MLIIKLISILTVENIKLNYYMLNTFYIDLLKYVHSMWEVKISELPTTLICTQYISFITNSVTHINGNRKVVCGMSLVYFSCSVPVLRAYCNFMAHCLKICCCSLRPKYKFVYNHILRQRQGYFSPAFPSLFPFPKN